MAVPENQAIHSITPLLGSCRKLDGSPADLMKPGDYPVEAVCKECGQPIRLERYYLPLWSHIERFTLNATPLPRRPTGLDGPPDAT